MWTRLWTWLRAALAVLLIAGFVVLTLGFLGSLIALIWWTATVSEDIHVATQLLSYALTAAVIGFVVAVIAAFRRIELPAAVPVPRDCALWQLACAVATKVGTRPPDHIRLVAAANAWVFERRGERYLDVGFPLLTGMSVDQLTAILAHEFGHYSRNDTRLAPLVYRGYVTIKIVASLPVSPWRFVARGYFWLYWAISSGVLRQQEWLADQVAAKVAGGAVMASALREVIAMDEAWRLYLAEQIALATSTEWAPAGICAGFPRFLAARAAELPLWREQQQQDVASRSTHPPMAQRIAALATEVLASSESAPAATLIPADLADQLDEIAFPVGSRTRIPLDEYAVCVTSTERQQDADLLYRAAGKENLVGVLDLLAAGQVRELATEVCRNRMADADPFTRVTLLVAHVNAALEVAAVRSGVARWRHSWHTWADLVDLSGDPLDLSGLADTLVRKPSQIAAVRAKLAARGVNFDAAVPSGTTARIEVLGAIGPVMANGRPYDVVVFNTALLLLPGNRQDDSADRLAERLRDIGSTLPEYGWVVPHTDMLAARLTHRSRANVLIALRDGTSLRIEEHRGTMTQSVDGHDPRQFLLNLPERLGSDPDEEVKPLRPAAPTRALTAPAAVDAERARAGKAKQRVAWFLLLAGLPLVIAAIATSTSSANLVGTGLALSASGVMMWVWGVVESRNRAGNGTVFIIAGLVFLAGFIGIELLAQPERTLAWSLCSFGAVLAGLGFARRKGVWAKRPGNGLKVMAFGVTGVAVTTIIDRQFGAAVFFTIAAMVCYVIGWLIGRSAAKSAVRAALGAPAPLYDTATTWGLIGLVYAVVVPPGGLVFGLMSIRAARRIGKSPKLGVIAVAISSTIILAFAVTMLVLYA